MKPYYPHSERNQFLRVGSFRSIQNTNQWEVVEEVIYVDPDGELLIAPAGFKTDFASVPPLARFAAVIALLAQFLTRWHSFWGFYALELLALWVCFVAEWLENSGTDEIATIHDLIYQTRCRSRVKADAILFAGMVAKGATLNPLWKRLLFWFNVRLAGWIPWMHDKPVENIGENKLK